MLRYDELAGVVTIEDAMRGFTGGDDSLLEGLSYKMLCATWADFGVGERFPWSEDAYNQYKRRVETAS